MISWLKLKELNIMEKTICVICAWRADCQKKFTVSGKGMKCVDFVKDLSIKEEKEEQPEKKKMDSGKSQ